MHTNKRKIDWENYHLISKSQCAPNQLHLIAQKELDARAIFQRQYNLSCDYGHTIWQNHLRSIIDSHKGTLQIKEEESMRRLYDVRHRNVCPRDLKICAMSLHPVTTYVESFDWNDEPTEEDRIKQRLSYLNLCECRKKPKFSIVQEEW